MAYKPIRMDTINKIRQCCRDGHGIKKTARILQISKNTVKKYLARIKELKLDLSKEFSIEQIDLIQDYQYLHQSKLKEEFLVLAPCYIKQLNGVGVTRYHLWETYSQEREYYYSYGAFCRQLKAYKRSLNATLSVDHPPGKVMQVDFAGKKLPYLDPISGCQLWAELLVTTLPNSSLCHAIALPSQKQEDFIYGINQALQYFGGSPQILLGDNLKSLVVKSDRYAPTFTHLSQQLAGHYSMELNATRVAKPKDKAHVERHVAIMYNQLYAPLQKRPLMTLQDLNKQILVLLNQFNHKKLQGKDCSRFEQFYQYEQSALRPLPHTVFEIKKTTKAKVQQNYHVLLGEDKHMYSVPFRYIGQQTDIVYTTTTVEIYINQQRIATHTRNLAERKMTTNPEHRPVNHSKYIESLQWTEMQMIQKAVDTGPHLQWAIGYILDHQPIRSQAYNACMATFKLCKSYQKEDIEKACLHIKNHGHFNAKILKNVLKSKSYLLQGNELDKDTYTMPTHHNIRGAQYYQ